MHFSHHHWVSRNGYKNFMLCLIILYKKRLNFRLHSWHPCLCGWRAGVKIVVTHRFKTLDSSRQCWGATFFGPRHWRVSPLNTVRTPSRLVLLRALLTLSCYSSQCYSFITGIVLNEHLFDEYLFFVAICCSTFMN